MVVPQSTRACTALRLWPESEDAVRCSSGPRSQRERGFKRGVRRLSAGGRAAFERGRASRSCGRNGAPTRLKPRSGARGSARSWAAGRTAQQVRVFVRARRRGLHVRYVLALHAGTARVAPLPLPIVAGVATGPLPGHLATRPFGDHDEPPLRMRGPVGALASVAPGPGMHWVSHDGQGSG